MNTCMSMHMHATFISQACLCLVNQYAFPETMSKLVVDREPVKEKKYRQTLLTESFKFSCSKDKVRR